METPNLHQPTKAGEALARRHPQTASKRLYAGSAKTLGCKPTLGPATRKKFEHYDQ